VVLQLGGWVRFQQLLNINEMDWACSMCRGRGEVYTGFWWGNLRKRDQMEDPGIDGRIILKWIF
jgi:hypothetical protein